MRALEALAPDVELDERPFGGAAIRECGDPLPAETLAACRASDGVLKAPIGDPEFDAAEVRPEHGMLALRSELAVYANLRPARDGDVDLLIVRELIGGLYYGARGVREDGTVFDTLEYHPSEVERIARRAFELARSRGRRLTSVDKANVLDTSRMWRRVVGEVAADYPDIELSHMLVDNAAMQLASRARAVRRPRHGEHVRGHPERPGSRHDRRPRARPLCQPRRRRARDLRACPRVGSRHRRQRDRQPGRHAPLDGTPARARPREAGARRAASSRRSRRHWPGARPPDLGGTATTTEFGAAVLEELSG